MHSGSRPVLFHLIHMSAASYCVLVSVLFLPCFGFDDMDHYKIFYRNNDWSYTLLGNFYAMSILASFIFVILAGSFHSLIYCIVFWLTYRTKPNEQIRKKGVRLTQIAMLLIIVFPVVPLCCIGASDDFWSFLPSCLWAVIIAMNIVLAIYVLPYLFIKLSYPQLPRHPCYGFYKKFYLFQFAVFLLLTVYWFTLFPAMLKTYFDDKYLYYWYR